MTIQLEPAAAQPPVALYIHVPFCVSLCPYCDFVVYAGAAARGPTARVDGFIGALLAELELRGDALDERFGTVRPALESVYLGGGTPSLLPAETIAHLLERVRNRFGVASGAEVTVEANPGPDERGDARALRDAGVTRLSIGAQAFDEVQLRGLGRRHRASDVADAVAAGRDAGIPSISLDLLYDLPGGTLATWERTLEAALALQPDHLSLYALTLDDPEAEGLTGPTGDHLPASSGARRWRERARAAQDDDRAAEQYTHATRRLGDAGWRGYEISNWARPRQECRHNLVYWHRRSYLGIGPGAHSFDGETRSWNAAALGAYQAALRPADGGRPQLPRGGSEVIDGAGAALETMVLQLRTDRGIAVEDAQAPRFAATFDWARGMGLARFGDAGRLVLTTKGRLLSNELFVALLSCVPSTT